MMLGLGLGLGGRAGGSVAAAYDPAALALYGWWRGSYASSPWSGTASAGSSGSRTLSEASNPPSAGSTVNGYAPADFDGSNDYLSAAGTMGDYYTAATYSGWALVNLDAIGTNNANPYLNEHILAPSANARHGIALRSNGTVWPWSYDTGSGLYDGPTAAISTGAWQLVQWKREGGDLKVRVNESAWATNTRSNLHADFTTDVPRIGFNPQNGTYISGKILDLALGIAAFSDDVFDDVLSYARARYALALT